MSPIVPLTFIIDKVQSFSILHNADYEKIYSTENVYVISVLTDSLYLWQPFLKSFFNVYCHCVGDFTFIFINLSKH